MVEMEVERDSEPANQVFGCSGRLPPSSRRVFVYSLPFPSTHASMMDGCAFYGDCPHRTLQGRAHSLASLRGVSMRSNPRRPTGRRLEVQRAFVLAREVLDILFTLTSCDYRRDSEPAMIRYVPKGMLQEENSGRGRNFSEWALPLILLFGVARMRVSNRTSVVSASSPMMLPQVQCYALFPNS